MKGRIYTEYRSRNVAGDTYAVTLEQSEGEVIPLDDMQCVRKAACTHRGTRRQGHRCLFRGG